MLNIATDFDNRQKKSSFFHLKYHPNKAYSRLIILKEATPSLKAE